MRSWENLKTTIYSSLKVKVIFGVCVILAGVMGIYTYWDAVRRVRFHLDREEGKAFELTNVVTKSIQYPMLDGQMEEVQAILESVTSLDSLAMVDIYDPSKIIRYSGNPDNLGMSSTSGVPNRAFEDKASVRELEQQGNIEILHYAIPVRNDRACFKCHGKDPEILGVLSVGIPWSPVESRVTSMLNWQVFMALVTLVTVSFFLIRWFSRSVTQPVLNLTALTDQISRGNLAVKIDFGEKVACWEIMGCDKHNCPAYGKKDVRCWHIDGTLCQEGSTGMFPEKIESCRHCEVYKKHRGDEIVRLADAFSQMTANLIEYEDELQKASEFQKNLIRGSTDGIVATDEKENIVIFNEGAEHIFGYRSNEVIGKVRLEDLYAPGEGLKAEKAMYGQQYGGKGKLVNYETSAVKKNGAEVPVWVSASTILDEGKPVGAVRFFRDLTQRKRLEKKLLESERLATIGRSMAYVSHEIKNPLVSIGGFARQLLGKIDGDHKNRRKLEIIVKEVGRLEAFLLEVTDITRPSKLTRAASNMNTVVKEVLDLMREECRAKRIEMKADLQPDLPVFAFDQNQITRVLVNLVKNAAESMPEGGTLIVTTALEGRSVHVTVADSGKGISPEQIRTIFDPFITSKPKGTGLGLTITRKIVEDHDGDIRVESKLGKGTTCHVRLPIQATTGLPERDG